MMKFLSKKRNVLGNKGFSLVELIIVIAIMAVLMAVLAPQLIKYVEKSRVQADDTFYSELRHAVEVALADDAIYSAIATDDTVVWDCGDGTITVVCTGTADAAMEAALTATFGALSHTAQSKTYKEAVADDTFDITFVVDAGTVTFTEDKPNET